jgi:uncharacterized protein
MSAGQIKMRLSKDKIADFCRRHYICKFAVFGAVLHGDVWPDSALDVLVEFEPGRVPGLAFFGMEQELSELRGRKVDLNTPQFLSPDFRDAVLAEAAAGYCRRGGNPCPGTRARQIPWHPVGADCRLANRLIHSYDNVDFDILWQIVTEDLPPLIVHANHGG